MLRGGQVSFYHADGLGSITHLTDATGTVARSYTYDTFGQIVDQTGSISNPYTYTAREFDPETGLFYYRARMYDPQLARFLQEDKLLLGLLLPSGPVGNASVSLAPLVLQLLKGNPQNLNAFAYVNNNPINRIDPFGLISAKCPARKAGVFTTCLLGHFVAPSPPGIGFFETILTCSVCAATVSAQEYGAAIVPCRGIGSGLAILQRLC